MITTPLLSRRPYRLLELPRFRAGYDFLLLRCESGELDMEIGAWWTQFQEADANERERMLMPDSGPKKRRRRRKPKGPSEVAAPPESSEA